LKGFLDGRFGKEKGGRAGDEQIAFEEFLRSAKGSLSPHEIARIRDEVGITGMGGN
jgi:ubiquitin-like protein 4